MSRRELTTLHHLSATPASRFLKIIYWSNRFFRVQRRSGRQLEDGRYQVGPVRFSARRGAGLGRRAGRRRRRDCRRSRKSQASRSRDCAAIRFFKPYATPFSPADGRAVLPSHELVVDSLAVGTDAKVKRGCLHLNLDRGMRQRHRFEVCRIQLFSVHRGTTPGTRRSQWLEAPGFSGGFPYTGFALPKRGPISRMTRLLTRF